MKALIVRSHGSALIAGMGRNQSAAAVITAGWVPSPMLLSTEWASAFAAAGGLRTGGPLGGSVRDLLRVLEGLGAGGATPRTGNERRRLILVGWRRLNCEREKSNGGGGHQCGVDKMVTPPQLGCLEHTAVASV